MADETKDPMREALRQHAEWAQESALAEERRASRPDCGHEEWIAHRERAKAYRDCESVARAALSVIAAPEGTRPPERAGLADLAAAEDALRVMPSESWTEEERRAWSNRALRGAAAVRAAIARLSGSATGAPRVEGASCPACGTGIVLATCDNPACRETWIGNRSAEALDKRHDEKRCPPGACARCDLPGHVTGGPRCPKEDPGCTGGVCEACGLWHCMSHLRDGAQFTSELAACPCVPAPGVSAGGEGTEKP